ncbi:MAG: translation elongation factor-like protein [Patescibacteria group bacterium]
MEKKVKEKGKKVGIVSHWYDKIMVAVIKVTAALKKGDKVKIKKGDEEFEETIGSMQIEHKDVASAKKGDDAAIKLSKRPKEGATVYVVK